MIRDQAVQIHTQGEVQKEAIGNLDFSVKPEVITAGIAASGETLKGAVAGTMKDLKIAEDIGTIRSSADSVASEVAEIQKIFLDKQAAAGWAEIELERILKDSFANVSIRKKISKLDRIPDASLKLSDGRILCIDSKIPRSGQGAYRQSGGRLYQARVRHYRYRIPIHCIREDLRLHDRSR